MALKEVAQFLFAVCYSLLGGCLVTFRMLVRMLKIGPVKLFSVKPRNKRPAAMDDPSLGVHGFLRTRDVKLHYVACGDESKPLMLMVHGFPECWYAWRFQMKHFAKSYRVVAIDMRSYGESDSPQGIDNYKMEKLVDDIKDTVEALGYKSCILVAHDWGGAICWRVASAYPDIVDRLIVCNIPHPDNMKRKLQGDLKQLMASWYIFFFQLPFLPELNIWSDDYSMLKILFTKKPMGLKNVENMTSDDLEVFKWSMQNEKGNLTGMINYYRASLRNPMKGGPQHVHVPVLMIWGDQDAALTTNLIEGTDRYVSNLTIKMVPGASHWVQQDEPEIVNKHMEEWLEN